MNVALAKQVRASKRIRIFVLIFSAERSAERISVFIVISAVGIDAGDYCRSKLAAGKAQ
jgi:hypothetical protein